MIFPTIHINGTSGTELLELTCNARHKVYEAMEAIAQAAPNGRDYYPQGPDALRQAGVEHRERIAKLKEVLDELNKIAEYISDTLWP